MRFRVSTALQVCAQLAGVALCQQDGPTSNAVAYNFTHFNGSIDFKSVVNFDFDMSGCKMQDKTVKSPIAPLDQGVSDATCGRLHEHLLISKQLTAVFRGPIRLNQFAVYNLHNSSTSHEKSSFAGRAGPQQRRKAHVSAHKRRHNERKIAHDSCTDYVTATWDGQVISFLDAWECVAPTLWSPLPATTAESECTTKAIPSEEAVGRHGSQPLAETNPVVSADAAQVPLQADDGQLSTGDWERVAYYSSASPQSAYNVTFLYPVAYSHTDFLPSSGEMDISPAAVPQILSDVLIPDNKRFYLASNTPMQQNAAPENKAFQGFRGNKIILVELGMPLSGLRDTSDYPDQPAFWMLNEQLPNTDDSSQCSCWASGCGEFDIHETLQPGALVGYSALHMGQQYCGGANDGFQRAVEGTQKLAVILKAGQSGASSVVRIVRLQQSYQFKDRVSANELDHWIGISVAGGSEGTLRFGDSCPDPRSIHFKRGHQG